jgi:hypothetical protein
MRQNGYLRSMHAFRAVFLSGCLAACASLSSSTEIQPAATVIPNTAAGTRVPTASPALATRNLPATETPQATQTVIPITETESPLPNLSAEAAKAQVFDVLKANGDCRLPCLWGSEPGAPDMQSLAPFVSQFTTTVSSNEDIALVVNHFSEQGGIHLSAYEGEIDFRVSLSYYTEGGTVSQLVMRVEARTEADQMAIFGNERFNDLTSYFQLASILAVYGKPGDVFIAPFLDDPDVPNPVWIPFSLVLYYPSQGILVEYIMPRQKVGNRYVGCPSVTQINVIVWDPHKQYGLSELAGSLSNGGINELNIDYFRALEDVTTTSLEQFYAQYVDPQTPACIETEASMWPAP